MANVKAYSELWSTVDKQNAAFQLTINQLKNYQDSIIRKLDDTRKELKIKDKNVQSLHYITSTITKTDTILLKDTIFKEPSFKLDSIIGDQWYQVELGLEYPSQIRIKPSFKSEKHIIVSKKRETVNPPKKFFLLRWFQKKHTVLKVDVVERNPYIQDNDNRYIEVIK